MAIIAINLDDNATDGLKALDQTLAQNVETTDAMTAATQRLSEEQSRQITVIHEQRAALSKMASDGMQAFGNISSEAMRLAREMLPIIERHHRLMALQGGLNIAMSTGSAVLGNVSTRFGVLGEAAEFAGKRAAGAMTGLAGPIAGATAGAAALGAIWAVTGKRIGDDGTVTTNLDRVRTSFGKLREDAGTSIRGVADEWANWYRNVDLMPQRLKDVAEWADRSATSGADQLQVNLDLLGRLISGRTDEADAVRKNVERMEEQRDAFQGIREAQLMAEEARKQAEDAASIASIKTLDGIEREREARRQMAVDMVNEGKKREVVEAKLDKWLEQIEIRRTQIVRQEETERERFRKQALESFATAERRYFDEFKSASDARIAAARKEYDAHREMLDLWAGHRQSMEFDANKELLETVRARMEAEGADAAQLHHVRLKQIEQQTAQRMQAARTDEERARAFHEGERQRLRAEAEFHRQAELDKIKAKKESLDQQREAQKEHEAKLKGLLQQAGAPDAKQMLQNVDPREVEKLVAADARAKAGRDFDRKHLNEWSDGDGDNRARLNRLQERAMKQAESEARRDFRQGKTDPATVAAAQAKAAQQQLGALQENGQLSQDVVKVLADAINTAAQEQAAIEGLRRQVEMLGKAQRGLLNTAQERGRAQRGSL